MKHRSVIFPIGLAAASAVPVALALAQQAPQIAPEAAAPAAVADAAPATQPSTGPATTQAIVVSAPTRQLTVTLPQTRPYDPNATVTFNFKDASIDTVIDYLSESLGFIIIREAAIQGRVTMMSRQSVGADDAVELLNSVLKPMNYTAIRTGRALRVTTREKAKKSNIPVRFGADPAEVRLSDELITQVIPLSQVDAVKLKTDMQPLFNPEADVTANQGSNTIVITDTSSSIRRIVEIISAMDKHMAATADIRIFQLQYASATNAAKLINDIFKTDETTTAQQQAGGRRFTFGGPGGFPGFGPAGAQQPGATDTGARRAGKVLASADDRTNTLVVTGPKDVLPVIERVVKELDNNPTETTTVFVYSLRNGQAQRLQDVLNSLFGVSTGAVSRTTTTGQRQPYGQTSTAFGGGTAFGRTGGLGGTGGFGGAFGGTGGFGGFGTAGTRTGFGGVGGVSLSPAARAVASDLMGQVFVVADPDTNSLLITTAPKLVDRVKVILNELDRAVPQVLIKVLLAEVTHQNGSDLGLQAQYKNLWAGNTEGVSAGTDFGLRQATGGLKVNLVDENFDATLRALATEGKVDVLSRPYILASDNQLASILVGQEVPFITNTRLTDTGQTINTVEYQDIGIILNVTPHINPDGKVIMDVAPEISSLQQDTTVKISETVSAPVFSKRSAQSRVAIDNGKTIVIGGLMEDRKDVTVQKVPLLGDIPIVGYAFKREQQTKRKTELLIFLTPHVAMDSTVLKSMSKDEMTGVKIVPNAVAPGTFEDHMQGLQRGATTEPSEAIHAPATQRAQQR